MKKISVLLLSVLIVGTVFTSCDKEEDGPVDLSLIEGKWNFDKTSYTKSGFTTPKINYIGNEAGCSKDYIEIKSGGIVDSGDYDTVDCILEIETGTWSQNEKTITVTVAGSEMTGTFDISTLTETELVLKIRRDDGAILNQSFTRAE